MKNSMCSRMMTPNNGRNILSFVQYSYLPFSVYKYGVFFGDENESTVSVHLQRFASV